VIDLSVKRPVATAAIYVALLALGAYSFRLIPVELLPDVEYPRVTVSASWSGASPEAMEAFVTAPLESAAQQVAGVDSVASVSAVDGQGTGSTSSITVRFTPETRMEFARLELAERVAALRPRLPPGVRTSVEPYVPEEFSRESRELLSWRFHGPYTDDRLAQIAGEQVRPALRAQEGVSEVTVRGGEPREIAVVLDRDRLEELGITSFTVFQRLSELSEPRPAGSVELGGRQMALAVQTRATDVAELRELVVASRPAGLVRLSDVARVLDHAAEPTSHHRIDGRPAVTLGLFRQAGTNAVDVADRAKAAMDSIAATLPPELGVELDQDASEDIRAQLTDLRLRAVAAAVVIFLVLLLFLRSLSAVLVVFATIGFSVLIAVNFLYLGGFTLNVLTLAGLAWGFGLVVDNGIVVLENVDRHRARGSPPERASVEGARQVLLPVVAATATTGIVLVPFLFFQGDLRVYYVPLAFAVGFSILASLFVAFTFVPALTARLPGPGADEGAASPAVGGPSEPLYVRAYRALLGIALDHPILVALLCLGALAGSWHLFDGYVSRGVRFGAFGAQRTYIDVRITFPRGAGLERTDELARAFEEKLSELPEVERYETDVRPTFARIHVTFPPELERTQVPVAIKEQMVAYSYGFSGPDVRVYGYGPSFYGGGSSPPNYTVDVLGYSYLKVQEIAEGLAERLERFSRIRQVDPNATGRFTRDRAFEYFVTVDRQALGAHDLSVQELLAYVSSNVEGRVTDERIRMGGEEIPVSVKLAGYRSFDFQDLQELRVPAGDGRAVRLADVATVQERDVLSDILRENQQYRRTVAWEFRGPRKLGDLVRDVAVEATDLPAGYRIDIEDRYRWSEEERTQVYVALAFGVLLIYMVTAALFESLAAPFVVLLTLPLALIGVFLIFFYTNATFTRTGYIGTIMMGGIVVNNAILIVYHIGELREMLPTREAIIRGTLERVRPILMTTLTTIFGLLPLILFAETQDANIWNALALATIGGLISSTIFVLVTIPVAYRWIVARGEV
jgi:HAE1 family hydrophobic/amphiphilic exporter-1